MKLTFQPVIWRQQMNSEEDYGHVIPNGASMDFYQMILTPHDASEEIREAVIHAAKLRIKEKMRLLRDELNQLDF